MTARPDDDFGSFRCHGPCDSCDSRLGVDGRTVIDFAVPHRQRQHRQSAAYRARLIDQAHQWVNRFASGGCSRIEADAALRALLDETERLR